MAIWYEVEKTKQGIADFMECNWEFHDFRIAHSTYYPETETVELLMKYDSSDEDVILRFLKIKDFYFQIPEEPGMTYISESTLKLSENGLFSWLSCEEFSDNIELMKNESTWIEAERIVWAITDKNGNPREMPDSKINQTWNTYGTITHKHFQLKEYL